MRFFRNPDGAVHSVPDDFEIPTGADDRPQHGWEEVSEEDAPVALRGSTTGEQLDPEVASVHLHDGGLVDDPSTPGSPGVADVSSSGHVGDDPEPATAPTEGEPVTEGENTAGDVTETTTETPTVTGEGFTPEATS